VRQESLTVINSNQQTLKAKLKSASSIAFWKLLEPC